MSDIFISYASSDRETASTIADALVQHGWSVWWDRKIPPGKTFDEVIENALKVAKCVIVLWSKNSVVSNWVKEEASEGVRRNILVPALIDDVEIPLGFRRFQAASLIDWNRQISRTEFKELVDAIDSILSSPKSEDKNEKVSGTKEKLKPELPQETGQIPTKIEIKSPVSEKSQISSTQWRLKDISQNWKQIHASWWLAYFIIGFLILVFTYAYHHFSNEIIFIIMVIFYNAGIPLSTIILAFLKPMPWKTAANFAVIIYIIILLFAVRDASLYTDLYKETGLWVTSVANILLIIIINN
jgi:hypothetical protein